MASPLDDAIDRAVREMMRVEPVSDIRRRVLSELEHPHPRMFTFGRVGLAAAAAAVLILFMLTRAPHPSRTPETVSTGGPSVPSVVPSATSTVRTPETDPDGGSRRRSERGVSAAVAVEVPETVRALPEITPLVVPSPERAEIEPDPVIVAPLEALPDLRVDPLTFPPGPRD